jgi:molybdate transport system substrate-binding protein
MTVVQVLSVGAAKDLATSLAPAFERETGHHLQYAFGAVGAMQERLDAGDPSDLIILSRAMVDALVRAGRVRVQGVVDLGRVRTGVAVCAGAPPSVVGDAAALRLAGAFDPA